MFDIQVNGGPRFDIQVKNRKLFSVPRISKTPVGCLLDETFLKCGGPSYQCLCRASERSHMCNINQVTQTF